MQTLFDQVEASLGGHLYYLSLMTALTIPDIAGAMESDDGRANGQRYADWYERWVRPQFTRRVAGMLPSEIQGEVAVEQPLTGEACYRFRCSLLHQGSSQHPRGPFSRIIFIEPGATTNLFDYCIVEDALLIDVPLFCMDVITAGREWLLEAEGSEPFLYNYDRFARRHPEGLAPHVTGVPVIG